MGAKTIEKIKVIFLFRQDKPDNPVIPQALGWVNLVKY